MNYICDFLFFSKSYDRYDLREGKYSNYSKTFFYTSGKVRIGVARPAVGDYEDEEGIGESPPDSARDSAEVKLENDVQVKQRESEFSFQSRTVNSGQSGTSRKSNEPITYRGYVCGGNL